MPLGLSNAFQIQKLKNYKEILKNEEECEICEDITEIGQSKNMVKIEITNLLPKCVELCSLVEENDVL